MAHFKTEEEYDNIVSLTSTATWVGLLNPGANVCNSASGCDRDLEWTDGTEYRYASWYE